MDVNKIYKGNCLDLIRELPDKYVNCVITSPREKNGRFIKGVSYSIKTQFKKGLHWRKRKPFWDYDWLYNEYVVKQKSAQEIANEQNVGVTAIQ